MSKIIEQVDDCSEAGGVSDTCMVILFFSEGNAGILEFLTLKTVLYVNNLVLYNNFIVELLSWKIQMTFVFMHMQLCLNICSSVLSVPCSLLLAPCLCFRVNVNYVIIEMGDYS